MTVSPNGHKGSKAMIRAWLCTKHGERLSNNCWHARCSGCGVTSAFDHSPEVCGKR